MEYVSDGDSLFIYSCDSDGNMVTDGEIWNGFISNSRSKFNELKTYLNDRN